MSGDVLLGDPVPHLTYSQMSRCTEVILDFITCSWSFNSPQQTAGQHERRCVAGRSCSTPDRLADESMYRGKSGLHSFSWNLPPLNRQKANMSGDVLLGDPVPHLTDSQMSRCTEVILGFITCSWSFTSPQHTAGQHERRCVAGRSCSTPDRLADESMYRVGVLPPLNRQQVNMSGDVLLGDPVPHLTDSQMSRCTEVILGFITCSWSFTSPQQTAGQHERRCVAGRSCSTPDRLADESMYRVGVLPPLNRQQVNMSGDVLLGDPVPHLTDSQMSRCTEVILGFITCSWSFTSPQQTAGQHERRCVAGRSCSTPDRLADESMYRVGVLPPLNRQQVNMSGDVLLGDLVPHLTDSQMSRCTEVILDFITCSWSFTSPQQTAGQHERRCVAGRSCSTPDRLADESMYRVGVLPPLNRQQVNMSGDVLLGDPVPHLTDSQMSRCTEVILGFITCSWSFTSPQHTAGQHERRCVAGRSCSTPDRLADESMYRVGVLPPLNRQQVNMSGDVLLGDPVPHLTDSQMSQCTEVILCFITCSWSFTSPQQTAGQHERRCVAGRSCSTPDRLADESMYRVGVLPPLNRQQVNMSGDVLLGDPVPHLTDSQMSRCTEVILGFITCSWSFTSPQQTAGQHERRCVAGRSCSTPDRLADGRCTKEKQPVEVNLKAADL
ncbi:hypothetical protein J6590_105515 [Homalodisca vitripennis]|nr:hypothetical protein J6590_105515 [Homalodisca vitripennis]